MTFLCCSNSFAFLLKCPSTRKRKTDLLQLMSFLNHRYESFKEAFVGCLVYQTMHTFDYLASMDDIIRQTTILVEVRYTLFLY